MPVLYMMFSVLSWSLFPLVSVWGISQLSVFDYILWTYVAGLATSLLILRLMPGYSKMVLPSVRQLEPKIIFEILIGSLTVLLSFACLLISFSYMSKAGATVIFEVWPIIAMYITPLLIKKGWEKISSKDLVFSLLAFIGIAFLLYPETPAPFLSGLFSFHNAYHLFLPLLGGIFMAVSSVMKARVSHHFESKKHRIASLLKIQAFFSSGVILLSIPFVLFWPEKQSVFTRENIMAVLFIGVFIHTLGNVSYTMAVLRSAKPNIVVLWYLMPIFSVLWLWLAGETTVTDYIIWGSIFIITSNLIMTIRADRSLSYAASMVTLLICGVYTYFVDGLDMPEYFQAISVPIVFYAILVAFMMDRLIRRDRLEEGLAIEIINHVDAHTTKNAKNYKDHIIGIITTHDAAAVDGHYQAVRNEADKSLKPIYSQLDQLVLSKVQGAGFAEMFVLSVVGLLTVAISTVYRPPHSLIADGFSVVLSLSVIFIYFMVLDMSNQRRRFYLSYADNGDVSLSKQLTTDLSSERVISSVLILVVLAAMIGLLWRKHHLGV